MQVIKINLGGKARDIHGPVAGNYLRAMKSASISLPAIVCLLVAFGLSIAQAEEKKKSQFEGLPQAGTLASTSSGIKTQTGGFGDALPTGGASAPLAGSVSRLDSRNWVAKIFNNSKTTVSVAADIVEYDGNRRKVRSTPITTTLSGGKSFERKFAASPTTVDCSLELRSWREKDDKKVEQGEEKEVQGE